MEIAISIVIAAISALSIIIGLFMGQQSKRDKRAEERQQELISCHVAEMTFARGTGSLARITATEVKKAEKFPIGNGDLERALNYYCDCEHALDDYCQTRTISNNVKG